MPPLKERLVPAAVHHKDSHKPIVPQYVNLLEVNYNNRPLPTGPGNLASADSDDDIDMEDEENQWWNTQYPKPPSRSAQRYYSPDDPSEIDASYSTLKQDMNKITSNMENGAPLQNRLSSLTEQSARRLRKNPKPSPLQREIKERYLFVPEERPSGKNSRKDSKSSATGQVIDEGPPPIAKEEPVYDEIFENLRKAALRTVDPAFSYVDERMEIGRKWYGGVHWFNLATPFKLILILEVLNSKMTVKGAMNMYRMSFDEREDYFRVKRLTDKTEQLSYHIRKDDYEFACRFVTHRLAYVHRRRLPSLIQMLRKYQGVRVIYPIDIDDYPPTPRDLPEDVEIQEKDDSDGEVSLQGIDWDEDEEKEYEIRFPYPARRVGYRVTLTDSSDFDREEKLQAFKETTQPKVTDQEPVERLSNLEDVWMPYTDVDEEEYVCFDTECMEESGDCAR